MTTTANTARDGTGTVATVFTSGTNGSRIDAFSSVYELPDGVINAVIVSPVVTWSSQNLNHIVTSATACTVSNNKTGNYVFSLLDV